MALVTGKIGLEDLALGEGIQVQDLGHGRTRTITKINAGNLPYDGAKSLLEVITDFNVVLQSATVLNVTENKIDIELLANNIAMLKTIKTRLSGLQKLSDKMYLLDTLVTNVNAITDLHNTIHKTRAQVADTMYREYRIRKADKAALERLAYVSNLCTQQIIPIHNQVVEALALLNTKIDTVKQEITLGNEMAQKMGSYTWVLRIAQHCKQPKWIIDDTRQEVILVMPKPTCLFKATLDETLVGPAVDAYLSTLATVANANGSGSGLVPVTQDSVNQALAEGAL